jgi:phosphomannomutase
MVKTKLEADRLPSPEALVAVLGPGATDTRDGVKWLDDKGWVHVRASNTEPVVRIIAEAQDEAAAAELIGKVKAALA